MVRFTCEGCGGRYRDLSQHLNNHPDCRPPELASDDEDSSDEDWAQPSVLATQVARDCLREQLGSDLHDLRFQHKMDNAGIALVKEQAAGWMTSAGEQQANALAPLLKDGVSREDVLRRLHVPLFQGLETAKLEFANMKRGTPYIEPRLVSMPNPTTQ